ncbi:MAG: carbohydrate ABC transporter permease [Clostridia bacterium]|nr:carbohydrate ABC transporter permease [Clostridia bacterium]
MPMLFLLLNSFKSQSEIIRNPLALPDVWTAEYIKRAFNAISFPRALGYTTLISVCSLALIVLFSSVGGWIITRYKSKQSTTIYLLFVSAMLIPFQAVMYPLMNMMDLVGLKNILGLIIMYAGFGLSLSIFLYSGFFKSVPYGIEEAALIDGANIFRMFFFIVFPLVKGITVTVLILNGMWIWNDYLLPYLTLGTSENKTLVLELFYAKMTSGQFGNPWELIFPAVLISVIPMVIVFLFLQKYFVKGVSAGAIKS